MSNKHLLNTPRRAYSHQGAPLEDAWWYEDRYGIDVILEPSDMTRTVRVKWSQIRTALARKDKA